MYIYIYIYTYNMYIYIHMYVYVPGFLCFTFVDIPIRSRFSSPGCARHSQWHAPWEWCQTSLGATYGRITPSQFGDR